MVVGNFIWAIRVAGVNAYKIYDAYYEEQNALKRLGLSPKWSHAEFLEDFCQTDKFWYMPRTYETKELAYDQKKQIPGHILFDNSVNSPQAIRR